jgi:hypothetical protein
MMVLLRQTLNELQTLDYDNIPLQKVQFLSIAFNGDDFLNYHQSIQMLTTLPKCKAWIKSTMAMLGVN